MFDDEMGTAVAAGLLGAAGVLLAYELVGQIAALAAAVLILAAVVFVLGGSTLAVTAAGLVLLLGALVLTDEDEEPAAIVAAPASDEADLDAARARAGELAGEVDALRARLRASERPARKRADEGRGPTKGKAAHEGKAADRR